jgi:hypothetical protein
VVQRDNARAAVRILKALRNEAHVAAANGLTEVGEIAQVAQVKFIDGGCAQCLRIANSNQLCATMWREVLSAIFVNGNAHYILGINPS